MTIAARWCWIGGLLVAGSAQAVEPGADADPGPRIEELRVAADRAFEAGDYRAALAPLTEGYALSRDPRFLFNLGVTHHALGECEAARESYEQYESEDPGGKFHGAALGALETLYGICGQSAVLPPAVLLPAVLPPAPLAVPAPAMLPVPALGPSPASVAAPLTASDQAEPDRGRRIAAWSLLSVGGATLIATGVTGVLWAQAHSDYEHLVAGAANDGSTWDACCAAHAGDLESQQSRYRALTLGFGIGAAVSLVAGAVLWPSRPSSSPTLSLTVGEQLGLRYRTAF